MAPRLFLSFLTLLVILVTRAQRRSELAEKFYKAAQVSYRAGNYELAGEQIEGALQNDQTADAYYLSGLIFEALGKDLRAVSAYEATLKYNPEYREAIFQKALIYLTYGDPAQALKDFNYLINFSGFSETRGIYFRIDPLGNSQNQVMSLATIEAQLYNYRGQCHDKLGNYKEALTDYNEAIKLDSIGDYLMSRGLLYNKIGKETLAKRDFSAAVALEPQNQLAWYNLTLLEPSVDFPDHLITSSGFAPMLSFLASRAMEDERYEDAEKYFDQGLKNNPNDALALINRGRVLLKMGKYGDARNDFNQARKLEPSRFEAFYLIGNSYFFQKNFTTALAYYNQYLTVDPDNAMVWYNGAMSYLEQDMNEEACHYLKKALTLGMSAAKSLTERYCK